MPSHSRGTIIVGFSKFPEDIGDFFESNGFSRVRRQTFPGFESYAGAIGNVDFYHQSVYSCEAE
ncbi:MAG TPA: hypothetical protein VJJ82_04105 [Candidatus Nanoarchaeia archaeon]|nr:hypothetical protein [Candidatus Nanoarchaeia archaeon]